MINHARHDSRTVIYWALLLSLLINSILLIYLLEKQHFHIEKSLFQDKEATVIVQEDREQVPDQQQWAQTYAKQGILEDSDKEDQAATDELAVPTKHTEINPPEIFQPAAKNSTEQESTPKLLQAVETISHATQPQQKPPVAQQPQLQKIPQARPLSTAKRKITAADIAKGFLNNMKPQGNRAITMNGDKDAKMTQDQLNHERYLQKLFGELTRTLRAHRHEIPRINTHQKDNRFNQCADGLVLLALNKDGSIRTLKLIESSGFYAIDLFILEIFKKASAAFAPVPDYLPNNPYTITVKVTVSLN